MTPNTKPIMVKTPKIWRARVALSNTARDGTGSLEPIATGGANGSLIKKITIRTVYPCSNDTFRFFIDDLSGTIHLWREYQTTNNFNLILNMPGDDALLLPAGYILKAASSYSSPFFLIPTTFDIIAEGGDF